MSILMPNGGIGISNDSGNILLIISRNLANVNVWYSLIIASILFSHSISGIVRPGNTGSDILTGKFPNPSFIDSSLSLIAWASSLKP